VALLPQLHFLQPIYGFAGVSFSSRSGTTEDDTRNKSRVYSTGALGKSETTEPQVPVHAGLGVLASKAHRCFGLRTFATANTKDRLSLIESGMPLSAVEFHMTEIANASPLPTALVAYDDEGFVGSTFVIGCDLEERAQYSPWIAAVWVERTKRKGVVAHWSRKQSRLLGYSAIPTPTSCNTSMDFTRPSALLSSCKTSARAAYPSREWRLLRQMYELRSRVLSEMPRSSDSAKGAQRWPESR
jgi:hypothetical protein